VHEWHWPSRPAWRARSPPTRIVRIPCCAPYRDLLRLGGIDAGASTRAETSSARGTSGMTPPGSASSLAPLYRFVTGKQYVDCAALPFPLPVISSEGILRWLESRAAGQGWMVHICESTVNEVARSLGQLRLVRASDATSARRGISSLSRATPSSSMGARAARFGSAGWAVDARSA
jgi:hypothetical protein